MMMMMPLQNRFPVSGNRPKRSNLQRSTQIGIDSGRSFNVSAGAGFEVISFQLLQEQDPE